VISKLKARLADAAPLTDPLEGVAFEYGFNTKRLQEIVSFWNDSYLPKWNERQEFLNQFQQFKTQIQGLNIHYLHVKPKVNKDTKVFPLLLLHGWPGSVREFYEIIPLLTTPSKDNIAFEVIAPSLPGFGFSDGAAKKGLCPEKIAVVMRNLMLRVGQEKFFIQCGDWVRKSSRLNMRQLKCHSKLLGRSHRRSLVSFVSRKCSRLSHKLHRHSNSFIHDQNNSRVILPIVLHRG
jgi:juvenile hormone epoxide hydrolase